MARLNSNSNRFITKRAAPLSHGVLTWMPVTDSIRTSPIYSHVQKKIDPDNGLEYYLVMQWLVKKASNFRDVLRPPSTKRYKDQQVPPKHELSSESTFKTARTRGVPLKDPCPDFKDTIYSFDWHPGPASSTPVGPSGELLDDRGNSGRALVNKLLD